jgi:hypothetical protein
MSISNLKNNRLAGKLLFKLTTAPLNLKVMLSKKLNYLGLLVGLAGLLTVYPAEIMTQVFVFKSDRMVHMARIHNVV